MTKSRISAFAIVITLCMITGYPVSLMPVPVQQWERNWNESPNRSYHRAQNASVRITSDADFNTQGWPGNGTPFNPYVIGGLEITGTDSPAILIENTICYFVISECLIRAGEQRDGIVLKNITSGIVDDCEIKDGGILVQDSISCSITKTKVNSERDSAFFSFLNCSRCNITDSYSHGSGILVKDSQDCMISGNGISSKYGLSLYQSDNIEVTRNWFTSSGVLINIWNGTGFDPLDSRGLTFHFVDNYVNGKDLGYFENVSNADIIGEDFGQIILVGCSGTRLLGASLAPQENGLVIPTNVGIQLYGCVDSRISDVTVSDCTLFGLTSFSSNGTIIVNSEFSDNGMDGVYIKEAHHVNISDCIMRDNGGYGIRLTRVDHSIINDNSIQGNRDGIVLSSSSWNFLLDNFVAGCFRYGIDIENYSINNTIYGNALGWNEEGNARDLHGEWNSWDDGVSQGNAWSDYNGSGVYEFYNHAVDHYPTRLQSLYEPIESYWQILELLIIGCIVGGVYVVLRKRGVRSTF